MEPRPKISIIIPTYNRSELVVRAINSVINQSYQDFEIILINNGSEDDTADVLKQYENNPKIRLFTLEKNIRYVGAFNFGIQQIQGEWFSELADDDWLDPKALETLLKEVERDPSISSVSCNSKDSLTGKFLGVGLEKSQYLSFADVIGKTGGQFWGINKSKFIGDLQMPKGISGCEGVFWWKIEKQSKKFYIHEGLHFFNVDEYPTLTQQMIKDGAITKAVKYQKLLKEDFFWDTIKEHNQKQYIAMCMRGFLFLKIAGYKEESKIYKQKITQVYPDFKCRMYTRIIDYTPSLLLSKFHGIAQNYILPRLSSAGLFKKHSQIVN